MISQKTFRFSGKTFLLLEGRNVDQEFQEAIDRLWPESPDDPPNLYRGLLAPED
jgi:hypothetical protein